MGRWAEVYFTSPPEKREEAVLDLLRQLEAENSGQQPMPPKQQRDPLRATQIFKSMEEPGRVSVPPIHQALMRCHRCGHENPITHQFCGMCGTSLSTASPEEFRSDGPYDQHSGEMENFESTSGSRRTAEAVPQPYFSDSRPTDYELRSDPYDLSMLKGLRERELDDYQYEEQSSPPYRYYIGAVLAILIVALGYMAWRGGQISQSPHQASVPPPSVPTENTPAPQTSAPSQTAPGPTAAPANPPKAAEPIATAANKNEPESGKQQKLERTKQPAQAATPNPTSSREPASSSSAEPPLKQGSGAEELAMAQHYLTGGSGRARDSAEAAKWLWKAMAKHNGPAALQLADLYLKGDGVSKNCDQARVLLVSAARRGMAGAGDRLRNLRAFGCQ
jgi:hypothetical protein